MKLKYFLVLLLLLFIEHLTFNITYATVRYVSTTGSSTPPYTSWETAADSIQKCINLCVDGDTIYVANGVYKENLVINTALSLIGSSMDSTVIDGTGLADQTLIFSINGHVENFRILGKAFDVGYGIYAVSNLPTIIIRNCNISKTGRGIGVVGLVAENIIMDNLRSGIISLARDNTNNYIKSCIIILDRIDSQGIALSGPTYANFYIENNILIFINSNNIESGISIGAPRSVSIKNNLITGFKNNIHLHVAIDSAKIQNNILRNSNSDYSIWSMNDDPVIHNNILVKNEKGIYGWIVKADYNLFWKNLLDYNNSNYGDSDIVADPMFVKDTIPTANGNYDFHLQKYSPAIDKGDPNILDVDGSRSDIGMYGGPFGETYTYQDLAPLAPRNLSAVVDSNYILVKWNKNTEADTAYYKVYRDTVSGFTIDSTKLVSSPKDTFCVQVNPHNVRRYVYKVTCVDKQGNESKPSEELIVNITSVFTDGYPMTISDYILYQNYPNPFNPSTKIGYQLKSGGYVKLMVYDIKGELISVLVNKEQNAGYYEVEFSSSSIKNPASSIKGIASGIYLYRIEVIGEGRIPVYTEMKKMLLLK